MSALSQSDPETWGPHVWKVIHIFTTNYPDVPTEEEKQSCIQFFTALGDMLPCSKCTTHYKEYLNEHYQEFIKSVDNPTALSEFFFMFHEQVNRRLNKKPLPLEKEKLFSKYETSKSQVCLSSCSEERQKLKKRMTWIVLFYATIGFLFSFYKLRKSSSSSSSSSSS